MLSLSVSDKTLWVDGGRPVFALQTRVESTIFAAADPLGGSSWLALLHFFTILSLFVARFFAYAAAYHRAVQKNDEAGVAALVTKLLGAINHLVRLDSIGH